MGASCGGFLVDSYLYDKQNLSLVITVFALCLAVYFSSKVEREEIQLKSKIYDFNQTDYYENEMGINLKKMYISIKNIYRGTSAAVRKPMCEVASVISCP